MESTVCKAKTELALLYGGKLHFIYSYNVTFSFSNQPPCERHMDLFSLVAHAQCYTAAEGRHTKMSYAVCPNCASSSTSLKANVWYDHLYSSSQPELS